jgi:glycosyltransferase involved in cell wall biosynthesis
MRIGYLSILAAPGEPAVSGVPKVSETLLHEFERIPGIEVEAISLIDGLDRPTVCSAGSVRYHYLPCKARGKTLTFYANEVWQLKRQIRSLNVQILHGQPTSEYLLTATGCGRPHVITVHGLVSRERAGLPFGHPGHLTGWIREVLHRRAIRRASNIISISPYVDDYLAGLTRARLWPIPNPIDVEFFGIEPPARSGLRLLCVGIVSDRKNQRLLIEACALLAADGIPFECRLVGVFAPGCERPLRDRVQELRLGGQVTLTGPVSKTDMLRHYAWSNAVVLPSLEETSPLSLIQGMAAGRRVFGADAAGTPRLLEGGRLGQLFPPQGPRGVADCLARAVREPDSAWAVAERAQAVARDRFSPAAVAGLTLETYRQISPEAAGQPRPGGSSAAMAGPRGGTN